MKFNKKYIPVIIISLLLVSVFAVFIKFGNTPQVIKGPGESCDLQSNICSQGYTCYINEFRSAMICQTEEEIAIVEETLQEGCAIFKNSDSTVDECTISDKGLCLQANSGSSDGYYNCVGGYVYRVGHSNTNFYDWYCLIGDKNEAPNFVDCGDSQTCDSGKCVDIQNMICSPNSKFCEDNKIMQCSADGKSKAIVDTCLDSNNEECIDTGVVRCEAKNPYYCFNNLNYECYSSSVNVTTTVCYNSAQECNDNIKLYCLTSDKKECVERSGNCLTNELSYKGPGNSAYATCLGQITPEDCENDDECDDNEICTIDKCKGFILDSIHGKCDHTFAISCNEAKVCTDKKLLGIQLNDWEYSDNIGTTGKCMLKNNIIISLFIILILLGGTIYYFTYNKKKGKK